MLLENDNKKPLQTIKKRLTTVIFGTPGWVRTSGLSLRRRPLYPTELRGLIQKIFTFTGLQDSNDSIFRRHVLYPTELLRHKNKSFRERLFRAESQHAIYLYYCIESKKSIPNAVKKVKCSCAKLKNHNLASGCRK